MRLPLLTLLIVPLAVLAAAPSVDSPDGIVGETLQGLNLASVTGQSPWLVMAGRGAYQYFTTPDDRQARLGLTAHPAVFGTLGVLLLLVAVKDSLLTFLGRFKVPLDVLGELFHVAGGAAGFAYLAEVAFSPPPPATVQALADTTQSAPGPSWAWPAVTFVMMAAVHAAVWVVFNTIEVAVILCPFPAVDTALKTFRTFLIGLITGAAAIHPVLGFLAALPVLLACALLLPFALRVTNVGWVFCRDYLGRWFGGGKLPDRVVAFGSWSMAGVTLLRRGVIERTPEGGRVFTYRRMGLLWRKSVPLPAEVYVGIGTLSPVLLVDRDGSAKQLLLFPPRYDRREQELAAQLGIGRVENVSLKAGLRWVVRGLWARMFGKAEAARAA